MQEKVKVKVEGIDLRQETILFSLAIVGNVTAKELVECQTKLTRFKTFFLDLLETTVARIPRKSLGKFSHSRAISTQGWTKLSKGQNEILLSTKNVCN